ncbi:MAG: hypothetical protein F6J90_39390 [Moorea sp. SIOASIH]|uniref:hypothetical protein n=1 Tax=Moorena sp. SIOASIH TaxID=2607817 RepID=UPI0013B85849|nr:hypothetical protein [Moorena sp. SIOASIH]NEO42063.1 hypothetical protein [Moorena sp. SIOASIH]
MTWQELQNQALQLPISVRWRLVQSLLASIEQETLSSRSYSSSSTPMTGLDPWTQSLLGVVELSPEDSKESYIDYLEAKYK